MINYKGIIELFLLFLLIIYVSAGCCPDSGGGEYCGWSLYQDGYCDGKEFMNKHNLYHCEHKGSKPVLKAVCKKNCYVNTWPSDDECP
jgi:hypothetical protein